MSLRITTSIVAAFLFLLLTTTAALAGEAPKAAEPPPDVAALIAHSKGMYEGVQKIMLRTAADMPEEKYGFKPVDSVRTFGQILGHAADAQYFFCSKVRGEKSPGLAIEKTKTSKADLIASLEGAFAYCNAAYDALTPASATQTVKAMGSDMPRLSALSVNTVHTIEHYGNLITYLRMNNLIPPTSDPEFMKQLSK